jgi:hypothetical protein
MPHCLPVPMGKLSLAAQCEIARAASEIVKHPGRPIVTGDLALFVELRGWKWCGGCKKPHPVGEFDANAGQRDGLQRECRQWREVNRKARVKA